jgi:hypothetical protein
MIGAAFGRLRVCCGELCARSQYRRCSPQSFLFLLPKKWSGSAKPNTEPCMMLHLRQFNFMTQFDENIDPIWRFHA